MKRLIQKIIQGDLIFKLYRYNRKGALGTEPFAVLVTPVQRGEFENFWLDDNNSWKTKDEALTAIQEAIRTRKGI